LLLVRVPAFLITGSMHDVLHGKTDHQLLLMDIGTNNRIKFGEWLKHFS